MIRVALIAIAWIGAAAGARVSQPEATSPRPAIPEWLATRLGALTPERPEDYFALAEEAADADLDAPERTVAQSLYALAFELARVAPDKAGLAASCCLGLADLERLDQNRQWLLAVAATIDPRYARPDWSVPASASEETASKAATALGLARAGEGLLARKALDEPGVRELLRRYDPAIGATGARGAVFQIEAAARDWPCPTCNNSRVVTRPGTQGTELRLCPACGGNPGPRLTAEEFLAQLRFEAILLRGVQRSWAAQVAVDLGAPLRDPDPAQLAATYKVDAAHPYWRGGAWVSGTDARR